MSCPVCGGTPADANEYEVRTLSHQKAFGWIVNLVVRIPKIRCGCCGGWPGADIPWARPGVTYTEFFEKEVFGMIRMATVQDVSKYHGIPQTTLWRMIDYRVEEALYYLDLSDVSIIYVDEKSKRKGQDYVTVFLDQTGRVIYVCDGRSSGTVLEFCTWLEQHGGNADNIVAVSCDLGDAYPAGVRE